MNLNNDLRAGRHAALVADATASPKDAPLRREVVAIAAATLGDHRGYLPGTRSEELLALIPEGHPLWNEILVERARQSAFLDQ